MNSLNETLNVDDPIRVLKRAKVGVWSVKQEFNDWLIVELYRYTQTQTHTSGRNLTTLDYITEITWKNKVLFPILSYFISSTTRATYFRFSSLGSLTLDKFEGVRAEQKKARKSEFCQVECHSGAPSELTSQVSACEKQQQHWQQTSSKYKQIHTNL